MMTDIEDNSKISQIFCTINIVFPMIHIILNLALMTIEKLQNHGKTMLIDINALVCLILQLTLSYFSY
jgi:hypothetical protein